MNNNVLIYLIEFSFFTATFVLFSTKFIKNGLKNSFFYKYLLASLLIIQILSIAIIGSEVGDVRLFSSVGYIFRHGQDIYYIDKGHGTYPFFPFLIFFHAFANFITETLNIFTFSFYLKLFLFIPLYFISNVIKNSYLDLVDGRAKQLQFLTLPVVYTTILFHGQTDILLIGFYFLSAVILTKKIPTKNLIISGIFFGASIATKTWSIFLVGPILNKIKGNSSKMIILTSAFLFVMMDIFIYSRIVHSAFRIIIPAVLSAGGGIAFWGMTQILYAIKIQMPNIIFLFLILFIPLQIILYFKKYPFWFYSFMTVLSFYLVITRWGIQYMLWIFPFIFMNLENLKLKNIKIYIFLSSVYTFFSYLNIASNGKILNVPIISYLGFPVWLYGTYWFLQIITDKSKQLKAKN